MLRHKPKRRTRPARVNGSNTSAARRAATELFERYSARASSRLRLACKPFRPLRALYSELFQHHTVTTHCSYASTVCGARRSMRRTCAPLRMLFAPFVRTRREFSPRCVHFSCAAAAVGHRRGVASALLSHAAVRTGLTCRLQLHPAVQNAREIDATRTVDAVLFISLTECSSVCCTLRCLLILAIQPANVGRSRERRACGSLGDTTTRAIGGRAIVCAPDARCASEGFTRR